MSALDATRTHARVPGPPTTVVLLHGAGDTPASWFPVRERLAAHLPVLTVPRTAARSPVRRPGARALLERHMDEITATVDGLPGPVVLVGHSFGGLLARTWSHRHPAQVAGLVLVDATPPQAAATWGVAAGMRISARLVAALAGLHRVGLLRILVRSGLHPLYPERRHAPLATTSAQDELWCDAVVHATIDGAAAELASVHHLARLVAAESPQPRVPTMVLASRAYGPRWVRWQEQVAHALGGSLRLTGDRSHNIHLRHPDLVADAVRDVSEAARTPA